jgi:hypothetical protein
MQIIWIDTVLSTFVSLVLAILWQTAATDFLQQEQELFAFVGYIGIELKMPRVSTVLPNQLFVYDISLFG